jgi:DNA-binding response OmpR family regulator
MVLLCGIDDHLGLLLRFNLEAFGVRVAALEPGEAVVADLVVVDRAGSPVSAAEVEWIHQLPAPVLVLVSEADQEAGLVTMPDAVSDVMVKPFAMAELVERVTAMLAATRA